MDLKEYLEKTAEQVDKHIYRYFGETCGDLGSASSHLLLAGGKRLRPVLLLLSADGIHTMNIQKNVRKGTSRLNIGQMKSYNLIAMFLLLGLVLQACRASDSQRTPAPENEVLAVIGFTESKTGNLTIESTRQTNGLNLWIQQVNAAGGIRLKDGRVLKFESKSYDDESRKTRIQQLYTRLAIKDNATFLISPYSSGLADAAAVVAEQYSKIMITTGAASDSTYQRGFSMVFQVYTPASRYLAGLVARARQRWRCAIEIVKRTGAPTFGVVPRRWVGVPTFRWLGRFAGSNATTSARRRGAKSWCIRP